MQFIKCSAAARGDGGGDMGDQAQRSVRRAAELLDCHLILLLPQYICGIMHSLVCLHEYIHALVF